MDALSFFNVAADDIAARSAAPSLLFAPPPAAVPFYLRCDSPVFVPRPSRRSRDFELAVPASWNAEGRKTAAACVSEGSEWMGEVRDSEAETSWRNWASNLLHIGYPWSEKEVGGGGNGDSAESGGVGEAGAEQARCECCGADQKNGFCEGWEGGEVEKFDGSTFPIYLKRVSLA